MATYIQPELKVGSYYRWRLRPGGFVYVSSKTDKNFTLKFIDKAGAELAPDVSYPATAWAAIATDNKLTSAEGFKPEPKSEKAMVRIIVARVESIDN